MSIYPDVLTLVAPNEKARLASEGAVEDGEEGEEMDATNADDDAMMAMMGMTGFGSTKVWDEQCYKLFVSDDRFLAGQTR